MVEQEASANALILTLYARGAIHNFLISSVEYIMSDRRILFIYEQGKETAVYAKMSDIEQKLGPGFLRCHQSYLVNMLHIKTFETRQIRLFSGHVIPISQNRRKHAREQYYKFLGDIDLRHT